MAQLRITDTHLTVRLTGGRRVFGRWRPLVIAWDAIASVRLDQETARAFPGARLGVATNIPGLINLGSFWRNGKRDFWDVADPNRAIVVELRHGKYDRLLLEVADPETAVREIRSHVESKRP